VTVRGLLIRILAVAGAAVALWLASPGAANAAENPCGGVSYGTEPIEQGPTEQAPTPGGGDPCAPPAEQGIGIVDGGIGLATAAGLLGSALRGMSAGAGAGPLLASAAAPLPTPTAPPPGATTVPPPQTPPPTPPPILPPQAAAYQTSATSGSSAAPLGGQGQEGNRSCAKIGDPVDVVSGQMITTRIDLELPGLLPLVLRRAYASGYGHGLLLGPGWSSTLDQRIHVDGKQLRYVGDDAQVVTYPRPEQAGVPVLPEAGAMWPLTWDADGVIRIEDPERGWTLHFAPSPDPSTLLISALTDRNDNRVVYHRAGGVPVAVEHSGGYRVAVDASPAAAGIRIRSLRLIDGLGGGRGTPLQQYSYDERGRLTAVTDATGVPYAYEYDVANRITAWTDRGGHRYEYAYDDAGRVVRCTGPGGALSARLAYSTLHRVTVVTDSLDQATEYHYDRYRHLTRTVDPLGHVTETEHDRRGRLLAHTDPLGNTTRFTRDDRGDVVGVVRPDRTTASVLYNELRLPVRVTGPDGAVWQYTYDARGNLLTETDPLGSVTAFAYGPRGHLASVTDPTGSSQCIETDAMGQQVAATDPLGATTRTQRDARGRVVAVTDPLGRITRLTWDQTGNLAARMRPDGGRETWSRDAAGNLTAHTDASGRVTRFTWGPFGTLTTRIDPDGALYAFAHDTELRLTKVTGPQGHTWSYEYDPAGNLVAETDFNGRRLTYQHDAAGQVTLRTNGAGQRVALKHDALGQVVEQQLDGQAPATFEYDAVGRLVRAASSDGQVSLTRDLSGRIVAETVDGRTLASVYDAAGRRVARTTPSGRESAWQYDPAGRPVWLTFADRRIGFRYDAAGRETHRWLSENVALACEWDLLDRLTTRRLLAVGGPQDARTAHTLGERIWTYQADDSPISVADPAEGARRFTLDAAGRVTAVVAATWTAQYAYDVLGNLVHTADSRTPDSPTSGAREVSGTLLRRAGRTSYEHDAQGRLIKTVRRTLSGGQKIWTFDYDALDRLTLAETPDGQRWRYRYDPLGRRLAKQRLGTGAGAAIGAADDEQEKEQVVEQIRFGWDGPVLAEQEHTCADRPEVTTTVWDYEPGSWTPLAQDRRSHLARAPQEVIDRHFHAIVTDLVGTPTELVAEDGSTVWRRTADLWGGALPSGTTPAGSEADAAGYCPLRFPGQYHDPETGLDYNFYRYYDPDTGRYAAADPLGLESAPNHHTYVTNPYSRLDPLGLVGGTYYRGSRAGESATFTARPNEFKVDPKTGFVRPTHGVSLFDNVQSIVGKGFTPNEVDPESVPDTLQIKQRGNDPRHYEIMPADNAKLTVEQYQSELARIGVKPSTTECG
jgi:RHS repeat-associated protein